MADEEKKEEELDLPPKQELFCQYYVKNREMFCNATQCYAEVYDYHLDELDTVRPKDAEGRFEDSERQKAENVCAVEGARFLRNPKIQLRITQLLNEYLADNVVDGELSKLIIQDTDWDVKIAAIREYNKLKSRIIEKIDHTTLGKELPQPLLGGISVKE